MGFLRFILAVTVIIAHAGCLKCSFGDGRIAVQAFYIISGFYMAMVWTEKYSFMHNSYKSFYVSRALRIYPLYFLVLILALVMGIAGKSNSPSFHIWDAFEILGFFKACWIYLTQLTLIGMETPLFYDFQFTKYMILAVAWSLGLELTFYLIVPYLIPRIRACMFIFMSSIIIRILFFYNANPEIFLSNGGLWAYRFFPFEISIFLIGAFAYYIFNVKYKKYFLFSTKPKIYFFLSAFLFAYLYYFNFLFNQFDEFAYWIFYFALFISVPALFKKTYQSKIDRFIGDLSYPMYIIHLPVLWIFSTYADKNLRFMMVITLTILAALFLSEIQRRIDKFRYLYLIKKSILN